MIKSLIKDQKRPLNLCVPGGVLAYITSNPWQRSDMGKKIRAYFQENHTLIQLINMDDILTFEAAIVETNILLCKKGQTP